MTEGYCFTLFFVYFSFYRILEQGGVSPSNDHSYSYDQILDAVRAGVGTNATIQCLYDKVGSFFFFLKYFGTTQCICHYVGISYSLEIFWQPLRVNG